MDYLKKPFGIKELSLRIKSLLTLEDCEKDVFQLGSLTFNCSSQNIAGNGTVIRLTKLESSFLMLLCQNKEKVVSKEEIIKLLWSKDDDPQGKESSLHNLAYKLRKMLEKEASVSLNTISKNGYSLSVLRAMDIDRAH